MSAGNGDGRVEGVVVEQSAFGVDFAAAPRFEWLNQAWLNQTWLKQGKMSWFYMQL